MVGQSSISSTVDSGPVSTPATNTQDTAGAQENNAIFGQLFELGAGNAIVPDMATGYTFLDHNLEVDIAIRPGRKVHRRFSPPPPAVAQRWNLRRDLNPERDASACRTSSR